MLFIISLVVIICMLTMLANKIKIAYPILLVLAGLALSLVPGMPQIKVEPEWIFIIFLPPLLFEAAYGASWKELWKWRRIILSFAFLVVFITACVVALVANAILPGFSIALGFLLGGIVSPPDAVSAQAIMRFVKVPKRFSSILEGESLFNDASSLIIMRVALVAVGTGQFVWYQAAGSFVWMLVGGLLVGLLVAWVMIKLHHYIIRKTKRTAHRKRSVHPHTLLRRNEALHFRGIYQGRSATIRTPFLHQSNRVGSSSLT